MIARFLERSPEIAAGLLAVVGLGVGAVIATWVERMLAHDALAGAAPPAGPPRTPPGFWTIVVGTGLLYGGFTWAILVWECQQAFPEVRPFEFWQYGRIGYHLILISLLVAATATDCRAYVIPDQITLTGMVLGLAGAALAGDLQMMHVWVDANQEQPGPFGTGPFIPQWIQHHHHWHGLAWSLAGLACGGGATWLVRVLSSRLLGQEALGFGDVTLMAMVGSFIGWQPVVCVLVLAPLCGLAVALAARVIAGRRFVPFGPYLALATLVVLFGWRWIWRFEVPWRPGSTVSVRQIFGDWPTLVILSGIGIGLLVLMLGLLRLYRAIPVPARHRQVGRSETPSSVAVGRSETPSYAPEPRLFAVVPAAGLSQRMGRPKLLLPLGDATVVARLLAALDHPAIAARVVVVRPDDEPLWTEVSRHGGFAVRPDVPPPDMRTSVAHALAAIAERFAPRADDGWLLVPADHPVLDAALIARLIDEWMRSRPEVLVPTCGGRRGHPTIFRWSVAGEVAALPAGVGLNALVRDAQRTVVEVELGESAVLLDLDTPADYEALAARWTRT
ncbi:MAG TPA: NTP transferase domain-containing protein [Planctomycetaceae bacterium]|nr:NTP transferase domain-containing protein [Planctomycetaceae bacterium]